MLDYAVEPLTEELIAEMTVRQQEYWDEVASPFHQFPPDPDWKTYMLAQQTGRLRVLCGRDEDKNLGAVAIIVIMPHSHYACIAGSLPLFYLAREHRKGREGIRLLKLTEVAAKDGGAQLLMTHGGVHNGVARLFEHMNYGDAGRYFVKVLGENPVPVYKESL